MKIKNTLLILLLSFSLSDTFSSIDRDGCEDFTNPEECYNMGCDWQVSFEQVGNELILIEQCVSFEGGEDGDYLCSDVNNPFECFAIGCEWEMNNNGVGICIDPGMMDDGGLDDGGDNGNECSQFPENLCEAIPFCEWNEDLNECIRLDNGDGGDDGNNNGNCSDLTQDECIDNPNCEWGEIVTPNGIFEVCYDAAGMSPCSDFGQEDCEWFDECVWTDQGCQDYDWNFDCDSDLVCGAMITCWEDGLLYPTTCGPENCDDPIGECDDEGCANLTQDECTESENCDWSIVQTPNGVFEMCVDSNDWNDDGGFDDGGDNGNECSQFPENLCEAIPFCEWNEDLNECIRLEGDDGSNQESCSDFNSPDECYDAGCEWLFNDLLGEFGMCVEPGMMDDGGFDDGGNNQNECSQFPENLCETIPFCEWNEDLNECIRLEGDDEGDGPPECVLDCVGIEEIDPQENGMAFCDWLLTVAGPSGCFEDCEQEVLDEIEEKMIICDECLPIGNCDEYFGDDNSGICSELSLDECYSVQGCEPDFSSNGEYEGCYESDDIEGCFSDEGEYFCIDCEWFINECDYYECTSNGWAGPFTQDECGEDDGGGDDGGNVFEVNLKAGDVVAIPGSPIEVPLYYNSQLPIAGVQFTLTDNPALVAAVDFYSLDTTDCFQTNFNDINGSVIGIMFSLEQCVLPVNDDYNQFATIVYQPASAEVVDWGSMVELIFSESIVSNIQGESVLVNAIGGSISFSLSGDNNFDGSINVLDVVSLINFILLVESPNDYQYWASDVNEDNALNVLDVVLLVDLILNSI